MKKRFIVCLENSNNEQDDLFLNFIKENGLGWWHYIGNFWLLTDAYGKLSANLIRDKLNEIYGNRN